jgi:glycosyltransferase involved in cell wall biosynthesis
MCKKNQKINSLITTSDSKINEFKLKWYNGFIGKFLPIPYSLYFREHVEITHFFSYFIPPGVKGKKVVTIYDMTYKVFPDTMHYKLKIAFWLKLGVSCKRADKIITTSEFSKNEIIHYLDIHPDKIVVIPCGVDSESFYPINEKEKIEQIKKKYKIEENYFLYLGTIEPRKNLERLIDAYKLLKNNHSNVPKLIIAGQSGWLYEQIYNKVQILALERDVIFLGYVPDEDRVPLICGTIAFVFPSLYEGFGMPPLEAMACGVPVLTSNVASLPEVVGDAAITVNPLSVEDITRGLECLLLDEKLRKELSVRGLKRAKQYSWKRSAAMTMEVYKTLL